MPMQTRSASRAVANAGKLPESVVRMESGIYVHSSPSETGEGIHLRWIYDESSGCGIPRQDSPSADSLDSILNGSLPSISSALSDLSEEESDQPSQAKASRRGQTVFDAHLNTTMFAPSGQAVFSSPKPLRRAEAMHWRRGPSGDMKLVSYGDSPLLYLYPTPTVDLPAIHERELAVLHQQKRQMDDALSASDRDFEEEMQDDVSNMFRRNKSHDSPQSNALTQVQRALSSYPEQWAQHRSTKLRRVPTEIL